MLIWGNSAKKYARLFLSTPGSATMRCTSGSGTGVMANHYDGGDTEQAVFMSPYGNMELTVEACDFGESGTAGDNKGNDPQVNYEGSGHKTSDLGNNESFTCDEDGCTF